MQSKAKAMLESDSRKALQFSLSLNTKLIKILKQKLIMFVSRTKY